MLGFEYNSRRLYVAVNSIQKTVSLDIVLYFRNHKDSLSNFRKTESWRLNCQIQKSGLEERMNVFSQSASRAEADSGDDSELSLSLLQKVQNEPFSFGLT